MADQERLLDLFGAKLLLRSANLEAISHFAGIFKQFDSGPPSAEPIGHFTLDFVETESLHQPTGLPLTWEGVSQAGYFTRIFESDTIAEFLIEDDIAMQIDTENAQARACFRPGTYEKFFYSSGYNAVALAAAHSGQHIIHAAGLIRQKTGKLIVIYVASGGGKTTTCLSLARDGFTLMSDDVCFLMPGDRPRIWAMPRALKVHRNTSLMMPWIGMADEGWNGEGEKAASLNELRDKISLLDEAEPTEVEAIIFLDSRSPEGHRIAPMPKVEALVHLAEDNVAWRPEGMTTRSQTRFDRFAELVAAVPTFRLNAGTDFGNLPAVVSAALDQAQSNRRAS